MQKVKLIVEEHDLSPFPVMLFNEMITKKAEKVYGKPISVALIEVNGSKLNFFLPEGEYRRAGSKIIAKMGDPSYGAWVERKITQSCRKLTAASSEIRKSDLSQKSNSVLFGLYDEYCKAYGEAYAYGIIPSTSDLGHGLLTKKLLSYLQAKVGNEASEYFTVLTTPTRETLVKREETDLLRIAAFIRKNRKLSKLFRSPLRKILRNMSRFPNLGDKLGKHAGSYGWLPFHYEDQVNGIFFYVGELRKILSAGDPSIELEQVEGERKRLLSKRHQYEKKLEGKFKTLFNCARRFVYLKPYRKELFVKSYWHVSFLLREIARRLSITEKEARYIMPGEMESALKRGKVDKREIGKRANYCVIITRSGSNQVFTGKKARQIAHSLIPKENIAVAILNGECACPGNALGEAKLVFKPSDLKKMNVGDILVSPATNPNLMAAIKKAAAIVTDTGGITSHAAIVARELRIPCVIGTKVATKALRDGDILEVDATNGIVRKS